MLGCVSCLRTDISRKVVLGIPSSSSSRRILYSAIVKLRMIKLGMNSQFCAFQLHHWYLQRNDSVGLLVSRLVDHSIRSLSDVTILLNFLVAIHGIVHVQNSISLPLACDVIVSPVLPKIVEDEDLNSYITVILFLPFE